MLRVVSIPDGFRRSGIHFLKKDPTFIDLKRGVLLRKGVGPEKIKLTKKQVEAIKAERLLEVKEVENASEIAPKKSKKNEQIEGKNKGAKDK